MSFNMSFSFALVHIALATEVTNPLCSAVLVCRFAGWPVANLEIPGSPKSPKYRDKYRGNTRVNTGKYR